jgi:hypothetical protein
MNVKGTRRVRRKLFLIISSFFIICLILIFLPGSQSLTADDNQEEISLNPFPEADISLMPERKFVENKLGEKILMEKEYFIKYSGTTIDIWEWIDENGEIQKKQIKSFIEWESDGASNPFEITKPKYHPNFKDEIGPPPIENARLIDHKFEGWINDGVLWSRWKPIAVFKEVPLESNLIVKAISKL